MSIAENRNGDSNANCSIAMVITCGLPGSGKSTFVQRLQAEFEKEERVCFVGVDFDAFLYGELNENGDEFSGEKWHSSRRKGHQVVSEIMKHASERDRDAVNELAGNGVTVSGDQWESLVLVLDDNFYYKSMRHEYYKLAEEYECGFVCVYFPVSVATAIERNQAREGLERVDQDVIAKMGEKMEVPNPIEGWERNVEIVEIQGEGDGSEVREIVMKELEHPRLEGTKRKREEQGKLDRQARENRDHKLDLVLKKCVGEIIGKMETEDRKKYGKMMGGWRKEFFGDVKQGEIVMDDVQGMFEEYVMERMTKE